MTTVVLVHGAWQGAWCWERVTPPVTAAGHRVVTPTLTGCGARAGELTREVGLDRHVADVMLYLDEIDDDVLLVGHSYSGMVLPGVVEAAGEQIRSVVFVDAFYPRHGESAIDLLPDPFADRFRAMAAQLGDGWRLPATDDMLDIWGLDNVVDRSWVSGRLTDWSLACFESRSHAPNGRVASVPRWYVEGTKRCPSRAAFEPMARRAESDGATVVSAPTGHDVMVEAPTELADVITDAIRSAGR